MDSKQFAWTYLLQYGKAGVNPAFYGGYEIVDERLKKERVGRFESNSFNSKYLHEIKTCGVDWSRTNAPTSNMISEFTDTFHDATKKEYLLGVLVLKNGTKQSWCTDKLDVTNVFEMMAVANEVANKFYKIFGEIK